MSASQIPLISESAELVELNKIRKRMIILLQNVGQQNFCKTKYVDGVPAGPGCGREIYFVKFRGGRPKALDEDGSFHRCPEIKP